MPELRLQGISADGTRLTLTDRTGTTYHLVIDERVRSAVRGRRQWQLEISMDGELSPREIQARVRRGESPEDIAAAAGVELDRVERFARPVLGERAHIVEVARATVLDPASLTPGPTLAERADEALLAAGAEGAEWDAYRAEDGRWSVGVTYAAGTDVHRAAWWYDPVTHTVTAADRLAVSMEEPGGDVLPLTRRIAPAAEESPLLSTDTLPLTLAPALPEEVEEPEAPEEPEVAEAVEAVEEPPAAAPAKARAKRAKRASVPSWDDIVFGARKDD